MNVRRLSNEACAKIMLRGGGEIKRFFRIFRSISDLVGDVSASVRWVWYSMVRSLQARVFFALLCAGVNRPSIVEIDSTAFRRTGGILPPHTHTKAAPLDLGRAPVFDKKRSIDSMKKTRGVKSLINT